MKSLLWLWSEERLLTVIEMYKKLSYTFWKIASYFFMASFIKLKNMFLLIKSIFEKLSHPKIFSVTIKQLDLNSLLLPTQSYINLSCCFLFLFFLLCHKVWGKRICADVFNEYILIAIFTSYQVFLPNFKLTIAQNSNLKHISVIKFEPIVAMWNTCR